MEWLTIDKLGKLELEEELIVGVEPVLFTVTNKENDRFLVMTYDSLSCEYIMVKISNKDVIDMLQNRTTMERTFRKQAEILDTYYENGKIKYNINDSTSFPEGKLPCRGEYYELEYQYIKEYIAKLQSSDMLYISGTYGDIKAEDFFASSACEMISAQLTSDTNIDYGENDESSVLKKELGNFIMTQNDEYNLLDVYSIAA